MRVLLCCFQSVIAHPIAAYAHWRRYLYRGLTEAGHEVLEVPDLDWAVAMTYTDDEDLRAWRSRAWEATLAFANREHERKPIDLMLGYFFPRHVDPAAILELQRRMPCVNFFCDNVREFLKVPAEFSPFALHWVPEYQALPMYRKASLPALHAAMPCWVPPALRTPPATAEEPATFIGSVDPLRLDVLGRALRMGADFTVRGHGWRGTASPPPLTATRSTGSVLGNQIDLVRQFGVAGLVTKIYSRALPLRPLPIDDARVGPPLSDEDYFRVTREARVTIGVNRVTTPVRSPRNPLVYSRLRDVEAPMLGACYLTEWNPDIDPLFATGTEIETWRDAAELTGKLDALLADPTRRTAMRSRAQARALADHSIGRTIDRIGAHFGL